MLAVCWWRGLVGAKRDRPASDFPTGIRVQPFFPYLRSCVEFDGPWPSGSTYASGRIGFVQGSGGEGGPSVSRSYWSVLLALKPLD